MEMFSAQLINNQDMVGGFIRDFAEWRDVFWIK
jgi:hypothetical protein